MLKLVAILSVLTAAACGSSGVSIGDYGPKLIDAKCDYAEKCGTTKSQELCIAAAAQNDQDFLTLLDAVDNGSIDYDDGKAGDCIDEIRSQSCDFEGVHTTSACDDVFVGTVAQGGACFLSVQCAGGAQCNQTDSNCDSDVACCPGTCGTAPTTVASGGSCGESDTCAEGTYCKPPTTGTGNGVCTAYITMSGAACDDLFACADPMICDVIFSDMPTCELSAPSGAACNPDFLIPCADSREYCDDATMKCTKSLADGAACMGTAQCAYYTTCISGTCQSELGVGATCNDNTPDCAGSLSCMNGTCQLPPAGMSCL